jgi:hypothetical protein
MPNIADLCPLKSLAVEFDNGVTIQVKYDDGFLTPEVEDRIIAIPESEKSNTNRELMEIYSNMIREWDLSDNSGKPIGTSPDELYKVPYKIINHVVSKIREDLRGNETSGE